MNTIRNRWKEQAMPTATVTLADIKARQVELDRVTRRRDAMEYMAGGAAAAFLLVVGVLLSRHADTAAELLRVAGFFLLPAGLLFSGWHLFRSKRASGGRAAGGDPAASGREYLRQRLERERRLLKTAWLWYVAPMVPGFVSIYLGSWLADAGRSSFLLLAGGITLLFLLGVALLNRAGGRRLSREIEELDREVLQAGEE